MVPVILRDYIYGACHITGLYSELYGAFGHDSSGGGLLDDQSLKLLFEELPGIVVACRLREVSEVEAAYLPVNLFMHVWVSSIFVF